jgi:threonine synthase
MLDSATASAYGALAAVKDRIYSDEGSVVLVSKDHPAFEAEKLRVACGEFPEIPESLKFIREPVFGAKKIAVDRTVLVQILKDFT